jgi:23S rRNA-/tRNA-specific pseudouridylate synthase
VHLAYLGWPIVGDRWYGRTKEKRLMLHAGFLAFNNPRGQRVEVEIPIPIDMIKINEEYGL